MALINELLDNYCRKYSKSSSAELLKIEEFTALNTAYPGMISGFLQGRLLSFISKIIKPKHILEIGTFTGYSSFCLAEGLIVDGQIISIEIDKNLKPFHQELLESVDNPNKFQFIYGPALSILPNQNLELFDLIFIDASKKEYQEYYNIMVPRLKQGAVIIVDNVLWKGQVVNDNESGIAKSMDQFNRFVMEDKRVENFILPLRDGLNIMIKK